LAPRVRAHRRHRRSCRGRGIGARERRLLRVVHRRGAAGLLEHRPRGATRMAWPRTTPATSRARPPRPPWPAAARPGARPRHASPARARAPTAPGVRRPTASGPAARTRIGECRRGGRWPDGASAAAAELKLIHVQLYPLQLISNRFLAHSF
jgi:hypothetical protein